MRDELKRLSPWPIGDHWCAAETCIWLLVVVHQFFLGGLMIVFGHPRLITLPIGILMVLLSRFLWRVIKRKTFE